MTKVWESAPYSEGTLLALLALADWADDDGICWPKLDQLAEKARLTRSGARYCIKKLMDDGAIRLVKESAGSGKPRVYQLGVQYLAPKNLHGGSPLQKGGQPTVPAIRKEEIRHEPSIKEKCFSCDREAIGKFSGVHVCGNCLGRVSLPTSQALVQPMLSN